ncbi:MAG: NAD-dependent succinate-semialdehyde dehydrogenase [Chitinophagales bacterium]|nr:NAD-dependent succinate-semialdehyde dehydrogenase [Bacteroidota bacterium]
MRFESRNPYTHAPVAIRAEMSLKQVEKALQKSVYAYQTNRSSALAIRRKRLQNLHDILLADAENLARNISLEMGKPIVQAVAEVQKCARLCAYFAENIEKMLLGETIGIDGGKAMVKYEASGTILGIMPWNYPFWQAFRFAIPNLALGNAVLIKPAPNLVHTAAALEEVFQRAYFPEGLVQNVWVDINKIKHIVADARTVGVSFTGSTAAGAKVARLAGKNLKKSVLELGGSDAFIVLEDANLKEAAKAAVWARMQNNGQSCIAAKRWLVMENVMETFTELVLAEIKSLRLGDPLDKHTDIGPLARKDLRDTLHAQVVSSVKMGAELLLGGEADDSMGNLYFPTILRNISPQMPCFTEETFGPLAVLVEVSSHQEAVDIANNSIYGLGASVWSYNNEKAMRIAKNLQVGQVAINRIVASYPELPFGGVKASGYGRELGAWGLHEFANIKTIVV